MVDRVIVTVPDGSRPLVTETFSSLDEFYREACISPDDYTVEKMLRNDLERKVRDGNTKDVAEVLEIAEEAVRSSVELRNALSFQSAFDTSGNFVDVGRFVSGEPECMMFNPLRVATTATPVITLVSSADANMGGGDWKTRGMIATALGIALHNMGLATEMWADNYGYSTYGYQYQRVQVKSTADSLDPAKLLFGFGDGDMLYCLAFGCFDRFKHLGPEFEPFHKGFGRYDHGAARSRTKGLERLYPDGTVFITGELNAPGVEGARMAVMNELKKLGLIGE